jgi:hypothetical protein
MVGVIHGNSIGSVTISMRMGDSSGAETERELVTVSPLREFDERKLVSKFRRCDPPITELIRDTRSYDGNDRATEPLTRLRQIYHSSDVGVVADSQTLMPRCNGLGY